MLSSKSFLVNDNIVSKDSSVLNEFIDWHVFNNLFTKNKKSLVKNAATVEIDARYDYRPDLLSYKYYGEDFYYPVILIANNIGSMLQFKSGTLDNKCLIPNLGDVQSIIAESRIKITKLPKENE